MSEFFDNYETPHKFIPSQGDYINKYKVIEQLGEGSFGIVVKVQVEDGYTYALKMIKLWEVTAEKERINIIKRFSREFVIASTSSKYLVKSHSYGKILGNPYIIMEYCKEGSLTQWCGRFSQNKNSDNIAYQILKGLYALHSMGYFHRDIKPANILLTDENRAKLTDFGIAGHKTTRITVANNFGKADQAFGTWAYLAPEQDINSGGNGFKALDAITDIFSFGVTMFELFTGELPFPPYKIESHTDLIIYRQSVKKGIFDNIEKKKALIPGRWDFVIAKCLEPNYQRKRFKNINEIVKALGYTSIDSPSNNFDGNPEKLVLQITYGEELHKQYILSELADTNNATILTIGRKDLHVSNIIEIEESQTSYISRKHATLEKWENPLCWKIRDGQWTEDGWKESLNHLYVNSQEVGINGIIIKYGDIITMGDTTLKVVAV